MSARNYAFAIGAGAQVRLPGGRYFFVRTATASIDVATEGNPGSPLSFLAIGAGTKFGPVDVGQGWTFLVIKSATAQNLEIVISDDGLFDVANTVTVAGAVSITEQPSATIVAGANTSLAANSSADIAANLSRRRITICNDLNSATHFWVRDQSATTSGGIQLAPGQSVELRTTAALRLRNNDGLLTANYSTFEES